MFHGRLLPWASKTRPRGTDRLRRLQALARGRRAVLSTSRPDRSPGARPGRHRATGLGRRTGARRSEVVANGYRCRHPGDSRTNDVVFLYSLAPRRRSRQLLRPGGGRALALIAPGWSGRSPRESAARGFFARAPSHPGPSDGSPTRRTWLGALRRRRQPGGQPGGSPDDNLRPTTPRPREDTRCAPAPPHPLTTALLVAVFGRHLSVEAAYQALRHNSVGAEQLRNAAVTNPSCGVMR